MAVRTEGQYSPVRLELARLVSSLLYGTRVMLVCFLLKRTSGHLHLKGFRRNVFLMMTRAERTCYHEHEHKFIERVFSSFTVTFFALKNFGICRLFKRKITQIMTVSKEIAVELHLNEVISFRGQIKQEPRPD